MPRQPWYVKTTYMKSTQNFVGASRVSINHEKFGLPRVKYNLPLSVYKLHEKNACNHSYQLMHTCNKARAKAWKLLYGRSKQCMCHQHEGNDQHNQNYDEIANVGCHQRQSIRELRWNTLSKKCQELAQKAKYRL